MGHLAVVAEPRALEHWVDHELGFPNLGSASASGRDTAHTWRPGQPAAAPRFQEIQDGICLPHKVRYRRGGGAVGAPFSPPELVEPRASGGSVADRGTTGSSELQTLRQTGHKNSCKSTFSCNMPS